MGRVEILQCSGILFRRGTIRTRNEVDSVTDPLDSVLVELEQFGKVNDASAAERTRRMLNITRDTGEFLAVLVRATLARRVLEIGTSNGYSTLWLANAARAIGANLRRVLRPGGLLVVDNATSHPEQMAPFVALARADAEFSTSLVPIGNGEFLAVRSLK
jgi:predicted O-methyltransferase YrrM